jgi:hypothetical protein
VPAIDVESLSELRIRAHGIIQFLPISQIERVEVSVKAFRWQAFFLIVKQIGSAKIQLRSRHQITELHAIHESPDNGIIVSGFKLIDVWFDGHSEILPSPGVVPRPWNALNMWIS